MTIWNKKTKQIEAKIDSDEMPEKYRGNAYVATSDRPTHSELILAGLKELDIWEYIKDGRVENYSRDEMVARGYTEFLEPGEELINGVIINRLKALQNEQAELQAWLSAHDYIGTKIATGRATREEYAEAIEEMNRKADRIDEINRQLAEYAK